VFVFPATEITTETEATAAEVTTRYYSAKYHKPLTPAATQHEICLDILKII